MPLPRIPFLLCAAGMFFIALSRTLPSQAQPSGDLVIAADGKTTAQIVVSPDAAKSEQQAALDLQKYIEKMTGARPALANTPASIGAALRANTPLLLIGQEALKAEPSLRTALEKVQKKNPVVRADALVARRAGNRIYLAGSNDESHYFAVSWLLQSWGCRWYMPTEFGECIPTLPVLKVGRLDTAAAPPFEIRHYWLSWNGDAAGANEFRRRNYMTETSLSGMGHALGQYTKDLAPPGGSLFNVPFSDPKTAAHVAAQIEADYGRGVEGISLAIEDGAYDSSFPRDKELSAGIYDKYMLKTSLTDAMLTFYNDVARRLRVKYPASKTRLGGMAYTNVTIPPQRAFVPEPNLVMWLAPIDIDPIHSMQDPNSPPRREYGAMMERWVQVMQGRLIIYDYDQGMLVWRDLPTPSYFAFADDVKRYRKAGILGIGTESRGAIATTGLNLFFRGQLMWNPDADVNALLAEFYPKFYGPAAAPMKAYWETIANAWQSSILTEHEHFVAPAIYTPERIALLEKALREAEASLAPLEKRGDLSHAEQQYLDRMKFTRLGFDMLNHYMAMVRAASGECDYRSAVEWGAKGLAAREALTAMNPTFTTYKNIVESGPAWWPGEVEQMRGLAQICDGSKGTLLVRTPLEWAFRRDPHDSGLAEGWAYKPTDLAYWNAHKAGLTLENRKDYPAEWEMLRTDLYAQAQGVRHPDRQSFTGYYWYCAEVELTPAQTAGKVHLMFPGLFNECWLYINGNLVAHREQGAMWWLNDYKFEWDVEVSETLRPGRNTIVLRGSDPHHFGGIFRRPFLYRPAGK